MDNLMIFENKPVEVLGLNGQVLFNPYDCGECLELEKSSVRNYLSEMNERQAVLLKNSDVLNKDFRKLNNRGEKFLTESGVYKLIFKSKKKEAERFQDWVTDEVLPQIRKTGSYQSEQPKSINSNIKEKEIETKNNNSFARVVNALNKIKAPERAKGYFSWLELFSFSFSNPSLISSIVA